MKTVATALLHSVQAHNMTDRNNWRPLGKNLNEKNVFWGENMAASWAKRSLIVYTANSVLPYCRTTYVGGKIETFRNSFVRMPYYKSDKREVGRCESVSPKSNLRGLENRAA